MKPLVLAFALILLPVAQAGADVSSPAPSCQKPDESLIKFRGGYGGRLDEPDSVKIKRYNEQGRAFNDCTNKFIETTTAELNRLHNEGNATIRAIVDTANRQQADIVDKVKAAIAGHSLMQSQPDATGWQFPDSDCVLPDQTLLKPFRAIFPE